MISAVPVAKCLRSFLFAVLCLAVCARSSAAAGARPGMGGCGAVGQGFASEGACPAFDSENGCDNVRAEMFLDAAGARPGMSGCSASVQVFADAGQKAPGTEGNGAPGTVCEDIEAYIRTATASGPLSSAQIGVMAVKFGGDTVVAWNSGRMLVPASNAKLISTGLALHGLGSSYRFKTTLAYSGSISGGTLHGDLYIIGGGDPTLGAKDSIAVQAQTLFSRWKSMIRSAGIERIEGRVIGDGRFFDGPESHGSWLAEDLGTYYGTGGNALSFYRNVKDFTVTAGASAGDPLKITEGYPDTPWMNYQFFCSTGRKGTGDMLYLYATDLYPVAELRGTLASDRKTKKVECSNKFGTYTCAWYFCKYLCDNGLEVTEGPSDIAPRGFVRSLPGTYSGTDPASDLTIIGETLSPEISRIAYITNMRSDNFYAEALYRILGREMTGSACYDSCAVAQGRALSGLGLLTSGGAHLVDGSGLSRKNLVSPAFFCSFLHRMMELPEFPDYIRSLPQPGVGTQVGRMRYEDASARERVYYKSGSMEGVRCYSGYVVPTDGGKEDTVIFSVMVNNYTGPSWKLLNTIDHIIALIAATN